MGFLPVQCPWACGAQLRFLALSFAVAASALCHLEVIRSRGLAPLAGPVHDFMQKFLDYRDQGGLILTHIYLLIGCALPVWLVSFLSHDIEYLPLLAMAGVISLGIGDAMVGRLCLVGLKRHVKD